MGMNWGCAIGVTWAAVISWEQVKDGEKGGSLFFPTLLWGSRGPGSRLFDKDEALGFRCTTVHIQLGTAAVDCPLFRDLHVQRVLIKFGFFTSDLLQIYLFHSSRVPMPSFQKFTKDTKLVYE